MHVSKVVISMGRKFVPPGGDRQDYMANRVLSKLNISPYGCWIWCAGTDQDGYGVFTDGRKQYRAHRVSYELFVGKIPDGLVVRHSCDNPPCCNPDHLLVGTVADNNKDARDRGRVRTGEAHHKSRVTDAQAGEIRKRWYAGEASQRELARAFKITQSSVWNIVHGGHRAAQRKEEMCS